MPEIVDVQWFPGHMAKTRRLIEKNLPLVDIVIEILDARAPISSANPDLNKIIKNKPKIILINKSDLVNEDVVNKWISYYSRDNIKAVAVDSRNGKNLNKINLVIRNILKTKIEKRMQIGMVGMPIRAMVVGIPNVGKSSFINKMAKKKKTKVEDRPGVTRGKQWVIAENGLELLDMPGVLWPKFDDKKVGEKLAFLGSVKDDILDTENLAVRLLEFLCKNYKRLLLARYKVEEDIIDLEDFYALLKCIGKKRGMVIAGGSVDLERAAIMVLDEFRAGKIGKISLEVPQDY